MSVTNETIFEAHVVIRDIYRLNPLTMDRLKEILTNNLEKDADVEVVEIQSVKIIQSQVLTEDDK